MKKGKKTVFTLLMLFNIAASFILFLYHSPWMWILAAVQAVIALYFFLKKFRLFVQSVFWPLFTVSLLALPWPLSFILPVAGYTGALFLFPKMKKETGWLKWGKMDRATVLWMIPVALVSSAALILWVVFSKPDLSDLKGMMPVKSAWMLVAGGLLFSVFNALWEEIILKGILWDGAEKILDNTAFIILFQAVMFGLMHLNGFPRGPVGAVLAGIYGILIGVIRKTSGGLLAPVVTHFFADATIFGILTAVSL